MTEFARDGLSRRAFVKRAVAAGGVAALSACLGRESVDVPTGPSDLSTLPNRQHAWNDYLATDDHGNVRNANHHVLLLLDYDGEGTTTAGGTPTDAKRSQVESALRSLERAYQRGNEGLAFTVGYTPSYFERYGDSPAEVDLPEPESLAPFEEIEKDRPDALVHLASDYGSVTLAAEEALKGNREKLNGVTVEDSLSGVLTVTGRRTGFIGAGLPAENDDVEGIPEGEVDEESPLYMGFKSGFEKNQASEDSVTIESGPFADGTTEHLSKIRLHLQQWYEQDSRYHRVATMFCPAHAEDGTVEGVGDNLGTSAKMSEKKCPMHTNEDAREEGVVGHSQKSARARDESDEPRILRRDFDSTDDDRASLHFLSLQQSISDFVTTRKQMNGTDLDSAAVGQKTNNGILQYMTVERRGNYLVPPRRHRSLPRPDPEN